MYVIHRRFQNEGLRVVLGQILTYRSAIRNGRAAQVPTLSSYVHRYRVLAQKMSNHDETMYVHTGTRRVSEVVICASYIYVR